MMSGTQGHQILGFVVAAIFTRLDVVQVHECRVVAPGYLAAVLVATHHRAPDRGWDGLLAAFRRGRRVSVGPLPHVGSCYLLSGDGGYWRCHGGTRDSRFVQNADRRELTARGATQNTLSRGQSCWSK